MTEPSLADLVNKLSAPAAQTTERPPSIDPMTLMLTFMQQQQAQNEARMREERDARREAEERRREERAESQKMLMALASTVLPKLLEKPSIDPFVLKLLDSSTNKDQLKDFLTASSQLNAQSQQMMMQQLATMFGTMGEMQSRMTERQMEMMETRLEKIADGAGGGDDKEEDNGIAGIIKAALPHLLGAKAPIAQAVVDAAQANPPTPVAAPVPAVAQRPAPARPVALDSIADPELRRKVHLLQVVMVLHQRPAAWDKRPAFVRTALHLIAKSDDIARAIMTDDQGALIGALAPAVQCDPVLGTWIGAPATQGWLATFIGATLKPALASIAAEIRARQERAAQQEPERIEAPRQVPMTTATLMPRHVPAAPVPAPAPAEPGVLGPADVAGE